METEIEEEEEAWKAEHFGNRRIAHGRRGKGGSRGGHFDPRRSYGTYQLRCPALAKLPATAGRAVRRDKDAVDGVLEIHGPADTHEHALICTFSLADALAGVALLAGSRKGLHAAVRELEHAEAADDEEALEAESDAVKALPGHDDAGADPHPGDGPAGSSIELADERERRRHAAFEKNSFRSPKFWMRWRAVTSSGVQGRNSADRVVTQAGTVEVNGGYLVFQGNDCARFDGTISCDALGWKNAKLTGTKSVSKTTECPVTWLDVTSHE